MHTCSEFRLLTHRFLVQSCPGVGDDTLHAPMEFFDIPDFVASATPGVTDDTQVDLVFVDFARNQIVRTLNALPGGVRQYSDADVGTYSEVLTDQGWGLFAQEMWN